MEQINYKTEQWIENHSRNADLELYYQHAIWHLLYMLDWVEKYDAFGAIPVQFVESGLREALSMVSILPRCYELRNGAISHKRKESDGK